MKITSSKLLWTGLTLIVAVAPFFAAFPIVQIGAVVMVIGAIMHCLDR